MAPEKLKAIRDLLPYVSLPWSRYFEGILETQQHLPTTLQTPDDVDEENDDDQSNNLEYDRLPVEARLDAMHRIKTSVIICRRSGGNVRSCGKPWNERVEDVARIDGTTSHRLSLAS
uniref:Uncharacterized protein n=1 Tax=Timema cristinae TaxID=61476 RepID=A0A7R9GWA4_TIMCR|nr:unnamed protein product [Timema cristinae]